MSHLPPVKPSWTETRPDRGAALLERLVFWLLVFAFTGTPLVAFVEWRHAQDRIAQAEFEAAGWDGAPCAEGRGVIGACEVRKTLDGRDYYRRCLCFVTEPPEGFHP